MARRGSGDIPPFVLGPVDLEIDWQDRVAITGPNGGGKSTLLAALLGRCRWRAGPGTSVPAWWWVSSTSAERASMGRGRSSTGSWPTPGCWRARPARCWPSSASGPTTSAGPGRLSPGERTRAQLGALMARGPTAWSSTSPPTTSTCPPSSSSKRRSSSFDGTLLLVTHDRWLLETVEVTRTFYVADGQLREEP